MYYPERNCMKQIVSSIFGELWHIVVGVFRGIWNDVLFPGRKKSPKDQIPRKNNGQFGMIRSQQDQLSSQAGELMGKEREIVRLKALLEDKSKECEALEKMVSSLEFALQEEINRNKRKR